MSLNPFLDAGATRMPAKRVWVYDTTLRDGSQGEGISFSVADKVRIARKLDEFGVDFIEGGWPGSNPKDVEFFEIMAREPLQFAELAAFGSTRRPHRAAAEDEILQDLLRAGAPTVTIFGKSWDFHVTHALKTSLAENLEMIADSVQFLSRRVARVIFDAEHFFDGYKANPEYAIKCLRAAEDNGAMCVVLCDTNGGTLPHEIAEATRAARAAVRISLGIHAHDDAGCGVANSLMAVIAGADHVQGTINGYGERCGNANLCAVLPGLALKLGCDVLRPIALSRLTASSHPGGTASSPSGTRVIGDDAPPTGGTASSPSGTRVIEDDDPPTAGGTASSPSEVRHAALRHLTALSQFVDEVANVPPLSRQPYVGRSAFAHKAGVHVDAVTKHRSTYEHVDPELVGNNRRLLVSELSGGATIASKAALRAMNLEKRSPETRHLLKRVAELEQEGYAFEGAEASFELLLLEANHELRVPFEVLGFRVIVEKRGRDEPTTEATVKLRVDGVERLTVAEGDGPVHALDQALRKALNRFYPALSGIRLTDFKVRVVNVRDGTAARVRTIVESRTEDRAWSTVGVSTNMIEASWHALIDGLVYGLLSTGAPIPPDASVS